MTIQLIAIGKTDYKALQELIDVYATRLKHYVGFKLEIIPDIKNVKHLSEAEQKNKEGKLILDRVENTDFMVLLDENGKEYNSVTFADYLQKRLNSGLKRLILVIGGPYGFSEEVYNRCQGKISLSRMTFSHQMARLFITEQIYRGFTILRNEPYHHR